VVLSGINGCELYTRDGCFITGHDPDTGEELWRTSTIALPGDPNNASWADIPPEHRGGGDAWIAGSYDPELKLFFIGTSQAKPWVAASRGMSAREAALYTNSTLALRPRTGEIVWYFQHTPGETIDMETGFERIIIERDGEKQLYTIGKDGILWQLDAATGKFRGLAETQAQTIYAAWNMNTLEQHWNHEQRAMFLTGVLTTGGGLAFVGDVDRYFNAFDVHNGKRQWRTRLGAPLHGYPVSYAVNGRQYIAVPTGIGVFRALTAVIYPEIYQPVNGQALYVFALPD
jgi:glucose dehydrogenase